MTRGTAVSVLLLALAGCAPTPSPGVLVADWCLVLGGARSDYAERCGCAGGLTDDELLAQCRLLAADSLEEALERGEVGWNSAIAEALVRRFEGECGLVPLVDRPVQGDVAIGGACRVFEDVLDAPSDCVREAACVEGVCVAFAAEGEGCDRAPCGAGLHCEASRCIASSSVACPGGD